METKTLSEMKFKIYTSDNKVVGHYDLATIKVSEVYKNMLELYEEKNMAELQEVGLLADRDAPVVKKVFEWMEHYKDPPPLDEDEEGERQCVNDIPEWDQQFLNVEKSDLYDIVECANFLEVVQLKNVCCQIIANMSKGKKTEELIKEFELECDIPEDELKRISKENGWFREK